MQCRFTVNLVLLLHCIGFFFVFSFHLYIIAPHNYNVRKRRPASPVTVPFGRRHAMLCLKVVKGIVVSVRLRSALDGSLGKVASKDRSNPVAIYVFYSFLVFLAERLLNICGKTWGKISSFLIRSVLSPHTFPPFSNPPYNFCISGVIDD